MEDRIELNGDHNDAKEKPVIHRVIKGDTLWEIAKQYGVTVEQIKSWNKLTSDMIYVDDCLAVSDVPEEAQDHTDVPKESTHLVKRGDTLWNISKKYGVSVEQIKVWNNLASDTIFENQILKIEDDETERA